MGIYAHINSFNVARRQDGGDSNGAALQQVDKLIESYLQSFPADWQKRLSCKGEYLLDVTTISVAHWCVEIPLPICKTPSPSHPSLPHFLVPK
jgi:hypothetical protein